jgi:mevalonate kinase
MVSTEEIETLCHLARQSGALGVKLTGSGGGGCVVALVEDDPGPIVTAWEKAGFRAFSTQVSSVPSAAAERSPGK